MGFSPLDNYFILSYSQFKEVYCDNEINESDYMEICQIMGYFFATLS